MPSRHQAADDAEVRLREPRVSVAALLVLRSILVFDAILAVVVGVLLAVYMERPAGLVFAIGCWVFAGAAIAGVRWADRLYDRQS